MECRLPLHAKMFTVGGTGSEHLQELLFHMIVGQCCNTNLNAGSIFVSLSFSSATRILGYVDTNAPMTSYRSCLFRRICMFLVSADILLKNCDAREE